MIADGIGDDDVFVVDSVLAVQCWMADAGVGGYLERDLVRITDGEPEILTRGMKAATRRTPGTTARP